MTALAQSSITITFPIDIKVEPSIKDVTNLSQGKSRKIDITHSQPNPIIFHFKSIKSQADFSFHSHPAITDVMLLLIIWFFFLIKIFLEFNKTSPSYGCHVLSQVTVNDKFGRKNNSIDDEFSTLTRVCGLIFNDLAKIPYFLPLSRSNFVMPCLSHPLRINQVNQLFS